MTEIEQLIELCPCPVVFGTWSDVGIAAYQGTRYRMSVNPTAPLEVQLNENLRNNEVNQLGAIAHETGHALCDAKGCDCMSLGTEEDREYHAEKWSLAWLLHNKCKAAIVARIVDIEKYTDLYPHSAHVKAWNRIKKLKLWEKCVAYAKSK